LQKGLTKVLLGAVVCSGIRASSSESDHSIYARSRFSHFYTGYRVHPLHPDPEDILGRRPPLATSMNESKLKYQFVDWLQNLFTSLRNDDHRYDAHDVAQATDMALIQYVKEKTNHFRILDRQYRSILIFKIILTAILLFWASGWYKPLISISGSSVAAEILVMLIIDSVEKLVSQS
jgi:hypothetical protein